MRVNILATLIAGALAISLGSDASAQTSSSDLSGCVLATEVGRTPILSSSYVDIDGDGKNERVDIRMTSGKLVEAEGDSCLGFKKYEGQFSIIVWVGGRQIPQSLNALWGNENEDLFFHAVPFRLSFRDYNHDGQPDFNLGQYENCNGHLYKVFTIGSDGRVKSLKFQDSERGVFISAFDNTTSHITLNRTGFSVQSYNNGPDARCPGTCVTYFVWNKDQQTFVAERVVPVKD
jgi:hypothetical protein